MIRKILIISLLISTAPLNAVWAQDDLRAEQRVFMAPVDTGIPKALKAPGLVYKGFKYHPRFKLDTTYSSNVYAEEEDTRDDIIVTFQPMLRVLKEYKTLKISGDFRGAIRRYQDTEDEDTDDYFINLNGLYEVNSKWALPFNANKSLSSRERGRPLSLRSSTEPLRIGQSGVEMGISRRFSRLSTTLLGGFERVEFQDGTSLIDGSPIVYQDNNRDVYSAELRARYNIPRGKDGRAEHILFGSISYDRNEFKRRDFVNGSFSGLSRDNTEIGGLIGFETTYKGLLFANIGVGYFENNFEEDSLDNVGKFDANAEIEWFPTRKWMIGTNLSRKLDQDNDLLQGELETKARLFSEYEIYHRLYLDGYAEYTNHEFDTLERDDDEYSFGAGLLYIINQNMRAELNYGYTDYQSNIEDQSYDRDIVKFSLIGKL